MAVPVKDADLVGYSTNFNTRGVATPLVFGLTTTQMSLYTPLHVAWLAAWNAANAEGGKSKSLTAAKNTAKANLLPLARQLYALIQSSLTVTDDNKTLMGVTIRKTTPSPTPPPAMAPAVTALSVTGRTAKFKIVDAAFPDTNRKPANAVGATIVACSGTTPPPPGDPGWVLQGQTGQNKFQVQFSSSIVAGTPCWVSAMWYTRRGDYSPASAPLQVYLQIGGGSGEVEQTDGVDEVPQLKAA